MRHLFALLLAASVWSCAPEAALAQTCLPVEAAVARLQALPGADIYIPSPGETKAAMDILNAMPPETDEHFDTMIFATGKDDSGLILLGMGGVVCDALPMPAATWRVFVRSVRGQGT